jgi:GNAT superfamily N-acetyltransferase
MTAMVVRSARVEDADQLVLLFDQLGRREAADGLSSRLEALLADPRADVFVADDGGAIVGLATYFLVPVAHEDGAWCRITALVVDEAHRGLGIGRTLVLATEAAAREAGCARIEATSALHRTRAHQFYDGLAYRRTSAHLLKRL